MTRSNLCYKNKRSFLDVIGQEPIYKILVHDMWVNTCGVEAARVNDNNQTKAQTPRVLS